MANSPRPGVWALEKSDDGGITYNPWQYFADTPSDCFNIFGVEANKRISKDDDVVCTTDYSKVLPVEGGEVSKSIMKSFNIIIYLQCLNLQLYYILDTSFARQ